MRSIISSLIDLRIPKLLKSFWIISIIRIFRIFRPLELYKFRFWQFQVAKNWSFFEFEKAKFDLLFLSILPSGPFLAFAYLAKLYAWVRSVSKPRKKISLIKAVSQWEIFSIYLLYLREIKLWHFRIQNCRNGENSSFWVSKWPKLISCKIWVWERSWTQCENFMIFLSCRFYVKSILGVLQVQNMPF